MSTASAKSLWHHFLLSQVIPSCFVVESSLFSPFDGKQMDGRQSKMVLGDGSDSSCLLTS